MLGWMLVDIFDLMMNLCVFVVYSAGKRDRNGGCCVSVWRLLGGLLAYCVVGDTGTVGTDRETDEG